MKRLIYVMSVLAVMIPGRFALSIGTCDVRYLDLTRSRIEGHSTITLLVYTSCYLETYPYLQLVRSSDHTVIAEADLESFGQPENTISRFQITIPDSVPYDLASCQFHMVSNMDRDVHVVHPDTATDESQIQISATGRGGDPGYAVIRLDTSLKLLRVKTFCGSADGGDMTVQIDIGNRDTFLDQLVVPLAVCQSSQVWIWIEGFAGPGTDSRRRFYGPLDLE